MGVPAQVWSQKLWWGESVQRCRYSWEQTGRQEGDWRAQEPGSHEAELGSAAEQGLRPWRPGCPVLLQQVTTCHQSDIFG